MPSYDDLKSELSDIAAILEKLPEQVRLQAYDLLTSEFLGRSTPKDDPHSRHIVRAKAKRRNPIDAEGSLPEKSGTKRVKHAGKESYSIDRDLDLRGDKSMPSFKNFYEEKAPANAKEFNAVAIYYLQKISGVEKITLDMAYTCYAEVKKKPPGAFRQSFIDTKNKAGWVEFSDEGYLTVPHRGSVFVEHDLPKPESTKGKK